MAGSSGGGRLGRGLRAGLLAGLVAGALAGAAAAWLVTVPAGVLRPAGASGAALGLWYFAVVALVAAALGLGLGLVVAPLRRPVPWALAAALVAAPLAPALLVLNVRHLGDLGSARSLAANAGALVAALVVAALLAAVLGRLVGDLEPPRWRWLLLATLTAVLAAGLARSRARPALASGPDGADEPSWSRPSPSAVDGTRRETLVLVTVDALRADHLGCYGYRRPTSPVIDRLAAEGTLFEAAIAQAPNTHPSLASMLTGRPLDDFDHLATRDFLPGGIDTLAAEAARRGYRTAAVVSNPHLRREMGFARGFDRYDDEHGMGQGATRVTDAALALVADLDGPVFLWVHYLDPHHPYWPPGALRDRFGPPSARVDAWQARPDLTALLVDAGRGRVPLAEPEWQRLVDLYDAEIVHADAEVGRLVDGLAAAGRLASARVVLTADHGEEFRDHGGVLHSHTLYRELVRLPLIVWSSGAGGGEGGAGGGRAGARVAAPLAATEIGLLLLDGEGAVRLDPAGGIVSEKLHEERWLTPPLVALRAGGWTLVVPSYRAYAFALEPRRVGRALRELGLFLPRARERELYGPGDAGERRDLAAAEPGRLRAMEAELRAAYRQHRLRAGSAALPSDDVLERLRALGYVGN